MTVRDLFQPKLFHDSMILCAPAHLQPLFQERAQGSGGAGNSWVLGIHRLGEVSTRPYKHRRTLQTTTKTHSCVAHAYSKETHAHHKTKTLV